MAANAKGIRAGKAYVEIGTEESGLSRGLQLAEAKLKAFGSKVSALGQSFGLLGSAITAPLLGAAKLFADAGSELADMSARTGLSVEALSELKYAAEQTGSDLNAVEAGVRKMQKTLGAAAQGSDDAAAAFEVLGLSVNELMRMTPDRQFQAIARALAKVPNPALKSAAAMALFGKSGTALLPMAEDMDALVGKARKLGLTMSRDDAEAADKLGDAMDTLSASAKKVAVTIGAALAPTLTDAADWLSRSARGASAWVRQNQGLLKTLLAIGAAATATGAGLFVLGKAFTLMGAAAGAANAAIKGTLALMTALRSPVVLVAAAVTGLGAVILTKTQAGGMALKWLGDKFGWLRDEAMLAFKGISNALTSGDIAKAAQIMWLFLRVEWERGVGTLMVTTKKLTDFMASAFENVFTRIARGIINVGAAFQAVGANLFELGDLDARLKKIESDRLAAQQALGDAQEANDQKRIRDQGKAVAELDARIARLKAELKGAVKPEANGARGAKEFGDVSKIGRKNYPEVAGAIVAAQQRVDVAGSFSADALRGLGAGDSVQQDQLKEQKQTNSQLQRINDRLRNAALVFEN
jgi:TP901 family phage tail tape measure protein